MSDLVFEGRVLHELYTRDSSSFQRSYDPY